MISLVDVLKDQVERVRERLYAGGRYQSDAIFYHSCRLFVGVGWPRSNRRLNALTRRTPVA